MIYTKWITLDGTNIKVPLNEEEIYSDCPICGVEVKVDIEIFEQIIRDDELQKSSLYCNACSDKYQAQQSYRKLIRIK